MQSIPSTIRPTLTTSPTIMPAPLTLPLPVEAATVALAQRLATLVTTAPAGGRIHLRGELGAGKTTLARALLRACGVTGRIKSPSYALLESYKVSNLYFHHFDFYRFNDPQEWLDAGFRDVLVEDAVILIEWPERAADLLPAPDLDIYLDYTGSNAKSGTESDIDPGRSATLHAHTEKGQTWLHALAPR